MKISQIYQINKSQFELDFIDVDTERDLPLFLDPNFIANLQNEWAQNASYTIENFFNYLIVLLQSNKTTEASELFAHLNEPNETCLGLSRGQPDGRGVGPQNAQDIFNQILKSGAIASGLVKDIEDCLLFVEDFGPDKLSDMTTNIIRKHLVEYTQTQCNLHNIPLQDGVPSGYFWDAENCMWKNEHTPMLIVNERKILLVPKGITSFCKSYTAQQYHRHFVLNFLQRKHLKERTHLIQRKFDKLGQVTREFVTKKSVEAHEAPLTKEFLRTFTLKYPDIFGEFRDDANQPQIGMTNESLIALGYESASLIEICTKLIRDLSQINAGATQASQYHNLIIGITELLFYPNLTQPKKEDRIHEGRKRIDITFMNSARGGFFYNISHLHDIPCRFVATECKNYSDDIANEELDQLSGRFSNHRGVKVGIIICRNIDDEETLLKRCQDTWKDGRGLILYITDSIIINCLNNLMQRGDSGFEGYLFSLYRKVTHS